MNTSSDHNKEDLMSHPKRNRVIPSELSIILGVCAIVFCFTELFNINFSAPTQLETSDWKNGETYTVTSEPTSTEAGVLKVELRKSGTSATNQNILVFTTDHTLQIGDQVSIKETKISKQAGMRHLGYFAVRVQTE